MTWVVARGAGLGTFIGLLRGEKKGGFHSRAKNTPRNAGDTRPTPRMGSRGLTGSRPHSTIDSGTSGRKVNTDTWAEQRCTWGTERAQHPGDPSAPGLGVPPLCPGFGGPTPRSPCPGGPGSRGDPGRAWGRAAAGP